MSPVISVENLSKVYRLGQIGGRTLHEDLNRWWAKMRGKPNPYLKIGQEDRSDLDGEYIWALKDVNFTVDQGEVIGIIGRNGAGKSTLLKIMSRVTAPTSGEVKVKGRIASLLEVGTGFHPDLTGRENIYLNGAILGMKKAEIDSKFDEIVAFAELEKFIDTPVKRYSSGMYVRLAFAVAAHLERDILLVDEVLAVGDMQFQKKCLGKMGDVAKEGTTVIFVSHNIPAITRLCERAILLNNGFISAEGSAFYVSDIYSRRGREGKSEKKWDNINEAPGNDIVRLRSARVCLNNGKPIEPVEIESSVGIETTYDVLKTGYVLVPNYHFFNLEGTCLFVSIDNDGEWRQRTKPVGRFKSTVWIPGNYLAEGDIIVGVAITSFLPWHIHFYERDAVSFQVVDTMKNDSARGDFTGHLPGVVRPLLRWITKSQTKLSD
jgi:lipopolysaccharide transport system ATP-binding protein